MYLKAIFCSVVRFTLEYTSVMSSETICRDWEGFEAIQCKFTRILFHRLSWTSLSNYHTASFSVDQTNNQSQFTDTDQFYRSLQTIRDQQRVRLLMRSFKIVEVFEYFGNIPGHVEPTKEDIY